MSKNSPTQLTLGVQLRDEANFANYFANEANQSLVDSLSQESTNTHLIYLWGSSASGKTHLAQAFCSQQAEAGRGVLYLPLQDRESFDPGMLQGTNSLSMVCLDDIESIAGDSKWEDAVFHLYNHLQESDTQLLVTASSSPQDLTLQLADLHSRLQSGLTFQISDMSDAEKSSMLMLRATNRGMVLNQQIADYIVQRADRNLDQLIAVLDRLDSESLQRGRKLTIPLVREVMGW